ncbi:MAG: FemAB family XrtA/PEP-CTERM system-associated protein [Pseudomonadota bacterium]
MTLQEAQSEKKYQEATSLPLGAALIEITPSVSVRVATETDKPVWEDYVLNTPQASFFHRWGYAEAISSGYGREVIRLVAISGNRIVGVAAFVWVDGLFAAKAMISLGFSVGGGVVANSAETGEALSAEADRIARGRGAAYLEIRETPHSQGAVSFDGWEEKSGAYEYFQHTYPIDPAERLLSIRRRRRAEIRKAIAAADSGAMRFNVSNDMQAFYAVYKRTAQLHGTPIFHFRFLEALERELGEDVEVSCVESAQGPLAVLLSFYHGGSVAPYYVGGVQSARAQRAFDYLYWMQLDHAIATRGAATLDFGRSKGGAAHCAYKRTWGMTGTPLTYRYKLYSTQSVPSVSPANPKYALAIKLWKRLPHAAADALGPRLSRYFG